MKTSVKYKEEEKYNIEATQGLDGSGPEKMKLSQPPIFTPGSETQSLNRKVTK